MVIEVGNEFSDTGYNQEQFVVDCNYILELLDGAMILYPATVRSGEVIAWHPMKERKEIDELVGKIVEFVQSLAIKYTGDFSKFSDEYLYNCSVTIMNKLSNELVQAYEDSDDFKSHLKILFQDPDSISNDELKGACGCYHDCMDKMYKLIFEIYSECKKVNDYMDRNITGNTKK